MAGLVRRACLDRTKSNEKQKLPPIEQDRMRANRSTHKISQFHRKNANAYGARQLMLYVYTIGRYARATPRRESKPHGRRRFVAFVLSAVRFMFYIQSENGQADAMPRRILQQIRSATLQGNVHQIATSTHTHFSYFTRLFRSSAARLHLQEATKVAEDNWSQRLYVSDLLDDLTLHDGCASSHFGGAVTRNNSATPIADDQLRVSAFWCRTRLSFRKNVHVFGISYLLLLKWFRWC